MPGTSAPGTRWGPRPDSARDLRTGDLRTGDLRTGDLRTGDLRTGDLPVRVYVEGAGEWRDLADWPPPGVAPQPWYPGAGGSLTPEPPAQPGISPFRYDPADPTPSVGGQLLTGKAGSADNRALEARPDVLVFTSTPLTADLDVIGPVSARVRVRASAATSTSSPGCATWTRGGVHVTCATASCAAAPSAPALSPR